MSSTMSMSMPLSMTISLIDVIGGRILRQDVIQLIQRHFAGRFGFGQRLLAGLFPLVFRFFVVVAIVFSETQFLLSM